MTCPATPGSRGRRPSREGQSLYQLLGVEKTASEDEIKQSYRRMALQLHPDKQKQRDNDKSSPASTDITITDLNMAKTVLLDPELRPVYDSYGSEGIAAVDVLGGTRYAPFINRFILWVLRTGGSFPR